MPLYSSFTIALLRCVLLVAFIAHVLHREVKKLLLSCCSFVLEGALLEQVLPACSCLADDWHALTIRVLGGTGEHEVGDIGPHNATACGPIQLADLVLAALWPVGEQGGPHNGPIKPAVGDQARLSSMILVDLSHR